MTERVATCQRPRAAIPALMLAAVVILLSACAGPDAAPYTPVNADYER